MSTSVNPETPQSVHDRIGLTPIVVLFRFYGFRFDDPESPIHRFRVAVAMSVSVLACALCMATTALVAISTDDFDLQDACIAVTLALVTLRVPTTYCHFYALFRRSRLLQRHLGAAVEAIQPPDRRLDCIRRIRLWSRIAVVVVVASTLVGGVVTVQGMAASYSFMPNRLKSLLHGDGNGLLVGVQTVVIVWEVLGNSFVVACATFTAVTCKILEACFDGHLPATTVGRHQFYHERLAVLVAEANEVVALYMLSSLSEQIAVVLLYSKSGLTVGTLAGLFLSLKQTAIFILTTIFCSNVNAKVTSSLLRNSPQPYESLQHFSAEHINYTMYLSQCSASTVKMTYGNIFAINKSFIFTIAGTTLTYTLILKDIA